MINGSIEGYTDLILTYSKKMEERFAVTGSESAYENQAKLKKAIAELEK